MLIIVNGESINVETSNLSDILRQLGYQAEDIVVARNSTFIPRPQWSDCVVEENDTLDILAAVVGG